MVELIFGNVPAVLGAIAAVLAAIWGSGKIGERKGRKDGADGVLNDIAKDRQDRADAGRAAQKAGDDSGLSPADRVRKNDGSWN